MKAKEILPIIETELKIMKCLRDIILATPNPLIQDRANRIMELADKNLKYMKSLKSKN